jgi:coatomer protein complex subunit alpha (xenin)
MSQFKDSTLTKPHVALNLNMLSAQLKKGYQLLTKGSFNDALPVMRGILHSIPLLSAKTQQEENDAKELIGICVEYINCIRLELAKQEKLKEGNAGKALELAFYMTLCKM